MIEYIRCFKDKMLFDFVLQVAVLDRWDPGPSAIDMG